MVLQKTGRRHYNRIDCPTFLNTAAFASSCHQCFKQNYHPNLALLMLDITEGMVMHEYDEGLGVYIHFFGWGEINMNELVQNFA